MQHASFYSSKTFDHETDTYTFITDSVFFIDYQLFTYENKVGLASSGSIMANEAAGASCILKTSTPSLVERLRVCSYPYKPAVHWASNRTKSYRATRVSTGCLPILTYSDCTDIAFCQRQSVSTLRVINLKRRYHG